VTHFEVNLIIQNRVEGRVNQIIGRTPTEKMEKIQLIGSSSPCESNRASPTGGMRPLPFKRDLMGLSLSLSLLKERTGTHDDSSRISLLFFIQLKNSVAVVRKRTIPTKRSPLVGEVSVKFCG
jgi:hypothetical protein